jgi:hypothetical protein
MRSDLKRIMARLGDAVPDRRNGQPAEQRILAEPGESRYQRRSAHLRERAAAIDLGGDESVTVDLTAD